MTQVKNKGGRPVLTEEQKTLRKEYLLNKIQPYLMSGLSVNKALHEAKILNSEFYKYMKEDKLFGEKVVRFRQYIAVLTTQAVATELFHIVQKQHSELSKNTSPQSLSRDDMRFLFWYALNANVCIEEWGRKNKYYSFDSQYEIHRITMMF